MLLKCPPACLHNNDFMNKVESSILPESLLSLQDIIQHSPYKLLWLTHTPVFGMVCVALTAQLIVQPTVTHAKHQPNLVLVLLPRCGRCCSSQSSSQRRTSQQWYSAAAHHLRIAAAASQRSPNGSGSCLCWRQCCCSPHCC